MKHEIIKKTLVYRVIAITIGLTIPILLTGSLVIGLQNGLITEACTLASYYTFEILWRKFVDMKRLKAGMDMYLLGENSDKHGWYNVVKVIDENKFVIEVV